MEKLTQIHYKKIFTEIIKKKFPEKAIDLKDFLNKNNFSRLDVIELNERIFGKNQKESFRINQKFKAYEKSDILEILHYQKMHGLNNSRLAKHFNISRNTVTAWKRRFSEPK